MSKLGVHPQNEGPNDSLSISITDSEYLYIRTLPILRVESSVLYINFMPCHCILIYIQNVMCQVLLEKGYSTAEHSPLYVYGCPMYMVIVQCIWL